MADSKIKIKVGIVEFSGAGESKWLSEQLDKILEKVPELLKIELENSTTPAVTSSSSPQIKNKPVTPTNAPSNLSIYLKDKGALSNQNSKFLTTAAFLQLNGKKPLTTTDVNKAIKDAHQNKLNNSSENLNQNVRKGLCEKDGSGFFVTQAGLETLN